MTSLQARASGVWFLAGDRTVFFSTKFHPLLGGYQVSSPGMKLATHLHLVPMLRISGAVPLLLLCAFVVWSWAYYGTWVFITVFTTAQCWIVLGSSTIQSIYAYIVCRRPSFQVPWFTFYTFHFIFNIHVTCLSCPCLLPSHKYCNCGLVHLFLYAITAFLALWVTYLYLCSCVCI